MSDPLTSFNSLGISSQCLELIRIDSLATLNKALNSYAPETLFILGGGSNILLPSQLNKRVLKNELKGIEIKRVDHDHTYVEVGGGVVWHEFVRWCVARNLGGVENLSLIPGTVGAAPMQNIGAYGVEIKDVFESLEAMELATQKLKTFDLAACDFGYRSSVFKKEAKGKYFITSVSFRLTNKPILSLDYGAIKNKIEEKNISDPSIEDISNIVIEIRNSKLPDPKILGNAGSFFKNPIVSEAEFNRLKKSYPDMPAYDAPMGYKLSAGWLIQQGGWKGYRDGDVGTYDKHALIIVNHGAGSSEEIIALSRMIQESVMNKFGVSLEPEVNFIS